jgi:hypothetical protein
MGSGNIWYTQAGVLLPCKDAKPKIRIQPFGAVTYKTLMLWNNQAQFDVGSNFS